MRFSSFAAGAAALAAVMVPAAAQAGNPEGKLQVKVLATAVLPDGGLKKVTFATDDVAAAIPAGADTKADDNYVPTLAIEYFLTPNISAETICCVTQHDVDGAGSIGGMGGMVSNAKLIPATLTFKYHVDTGAGFKPYLGAGVSYFMFFDEKAGSLSQALGAADSKIDDEFAFALQAGFDVPLNDTGLGLSVDAKRYFIDVDAHWYDDAGAEILSTKHKLDPWVISAGLAYRF